jgi:YfiH family protein
VGLGIKTADCVPLLLEDPVGRRVAAVHAGWRGTIAEIPKVALDELMQRGTQARDVRAAIGPCIRACCYAVGEDLSERFVARFGAKVSQRRDGLVFLDLAFAVRSTLEARGVSQIDDSVSLCTSCDARFYSFRRDRGAPGRQISFIVCEWDSPAPATSL